MKCTWSVVSILTAFLSGVALGVIVYRFVKGESNPDFLALLLSFALLFGVIAWMSNQLANST